MLRKFLYLFLPVTIIALLSYRCANPVTPQGGPKDEKPPRVLACDPPPFSLHFDRKSVRIDFDEFISLKNPATEIFVSPPLKNPPEARIKGKSIILDISDTLKPNTTYSVSFGLAVTDLTEGNVLKGYSYVFSTGDYIDSLSLAGMVRSAFDLTPQKDVHVGLYLKVPDSIPFDSLPMKKAPFYITRTDENGRFTLDNLRNTPGRLFALGDQNSDLVFNQLTEKIAFSDSLVTPGFTGKKSTDTTVKNDTARTADSATFHQKQVPLYFLSLFEQPDTLQRLLKSSFVSRNKILLIFRQPIGDFNVKAPWLADSSSWFFPEYSRNRDSVTLWITRKGLDSLTLVVGAHGIHDDTISLTQEQGITKPKKGEKVISELNIVNPSTGYSFNQFRSTLVLEWSYPLLQVEPTKFLLFEDKDTLNVDVQFTDSLHRFMEIRHKWKEEKPCKLIIPGSAVTGLNGSLGDTLTFSFRTRAEKDFGNLNLAVNLPDWEGRYIIQLMNEKENVIYEQVRTKGKETIRFRYLPPLKYKLKAIKDLNGNGKWDPGNYFRLLQPEEVFYFPKGVEIRANWDIDETWN